MCLRAQLRCPGALVLPLGAAATAKGGGEGHRHLLATTSACLVAEPVRP
jgi:hypothetical protein